MPEIIPPNLDPQRFNHLDPLVFGEYNAAGDVGWRRAISEIAGYYLRQSPFDNFLGDRGELEEDILQAWKDNLANNLVDNSAQELAEFILTVLVTVTGEAIPGVTPPEPPEDLPIVDVPLPPEPPIVPPREREPFPPIVTPRDPQPPRDRQPPPEPPEPPEPPPEPPTESPRRPDRDRPPGGTNIPIPPTPGFPSLPRPIEPPTPRERPSPVDETPEETTSPPRPLEEPVQVEGNPEEDSPPVKVGIDYGALEEAIFRALVRWTATTISNPGKVICETIPTEEVSQEDLITEIASQVETYRAAGEEIVNAEPSVSDNKGQNIFTVPGE